MIEIIFVILLAITIVNGFICAANVCPSQHHPLIRWLVIVPVIAALFTLHCMVQGDYSVFPADILRVAATNAVYVLLTGHLVGKGWLGRGRE